MTEPASGVGYNAYGAIYDAVERHRADLLRLERAATADTLRAYRKVWARMRKRVQTLAKQHQAAIESGTSPDQAWIADYQRVSELMAQVDGDLRRLHDQVYRRTVTAESRAIEASGHHFRDVLAITGDAYGDPGIVASFSRVPLEAMRDMVGTLRPGTPLRVLLDGLGVVASQQIREELLAGLALGEGPRAVARRIRGALGGDMARALRISRTETLRAYRTATNEHYKANDGVVNGWRWLAAKDARTCPACLALDGTWHPSSEVQQDHPNGRCTSIPALRDRDNPEGAAPWETGTQWLAKQTPEVQQQVLGKAAAEAYQQGKITLADLQGTRTSALWGTTPRVRALGELGLKAGEPDPIAGELLGDIHGPWTDAWPDMVTRQTVLTDERRGHVIEQHPEIGLYLDQLPELVTEPDEVHRNRIDPRIAILYRGAGEDLYMRAALWISDVRGLLNSVHSVRFARSSELDRARRQGRLIWKR